jgi:hypothetical protein
VTAPAMGPGPLSKAFEEFHKLNPHVYRILVRLARRWLRTGRSKGSIDAFYNVARWEIAMSTTDDEYKLNDHYKAFYARLIMWREPDLDGLFDLRAAEADAWLQDLIARGGII